MDMVIPCKFFGRSKHTELALSARQDVVSPPLGSVMSKESAAFRITAGHLEYQAITFLCYHRCSPDLDVNGIYFAWQDREDVL